MPILLTTYLAALVTTPLFLAYEFTLFLVKETDHPKIKRLNHCENYPIFT